MALEYFRQEFDKYGPSQVFQKRMYRTQPLKSKEVRIQVAFIGINFADVIARKGYYKWADAPPVCPGFEVSGHVLEIGSEVTDLRVGDPVLAVTRFGGYTEILTTDESRVRPIPPNMTLEEAAALPAVYITAYHSLWEVLRIRKKDDILIQAVAGGVGTAALQICKHVGLTVYGTASTEAKLQYAKQFGLDYGINYLKEDFEDAIQRLTKHQGVKFLLDSIGGHVLKKGIRCLQPSGHAVTIGAANVVPPSKLRTFQDVQEWNRIAIDMIKGGWFHPFYFIENNCGLSGVQILLLWEQVDYLNQLMDDLFTLYSKNAIQPYIHEIFDFEKVAQAHDFMESRQSKGKILLAVSHNP